MDTAARRACAALWSFRGVGPVTLAAVHTAFGDPGRLLDAPIADWSAGVSWRGDAAAELAQWSTLALRAEWLEATCHATRVSIAFSGDPQWPDRLNGIDDPPPLLFVRGPGGRRRGRRLAIVGTRHPGTERAEKLRAIAAEAAARGLGIVSGAAIGIDQAAHRGALDAGGETWAFLGSALDQIDAPQVAVTTAILDAGGSLFSEFPPGFRANMNSFRRRNRLISGASDAVLIFCAHLKSGSLYTAEDAEAQKRPLLATPTDPWNEAGQGGNELLRKRRAQPHFDVSDLLKATGLAGAMAHDQPPAELDLLLLSDDGRRVFEAMPRGCTDFEALRAAAGDLSSGQLSAALLELEVLGAVLHRGGRRYEKR